MRVVLLGDSHLARVRRDLPRIVPRAVEGSEHLEVVNVAVGGSIVGDVAAQAGGAGVGADDVAVLSIGTNDALPARPVPVAAFAEAMRGLLTLVRPAAWVYLVPPLPGAAGHATATVAALEDDAAAGAPAVVVDTPALLAPLGPRAFLPDGLHLTGAGYDVVLPALAEAVGELTRRS